MINRLTFSNQVISSSNLYGTTYSKNVNSADDIQVGGAYAAKLTFTTDIATLNVGDTFTYAVSIDGNTYNDVGIFKIYAINKTKSKYECECYDNIAVLDGVCDAYLNGLTWPVTLYSLYTGLCTYFGLTANESSITNGTFEVQGSFTHQNLTGRQLLSYIAQLAGGFAEALADGKINISYFTASGLSINSWKKLEKANENAAVIDKVSILYQTDDIGVSYGTGNEVLNIVGNPLTYGGQSGLSTVAQNIYNIVHNYVYRPFEMNAFDDAIYRAGTTLTIDSITYYIFNVDRSSSDTVISATGNSTRNVDDVLGGDYEIYATEVKYNTLTRNLEETKSTISAVSSIANNATTIAQNAYNISLEAQDNLNEIGTSLEIASTGVYVYNVENGERDTNNYIKMTGAGIDIYADQAGKVLSMNQDGVQAKGELTAEVGLTVNDFKWVTSNGYLILQKL